MSNRPPAKYWERYTATDGTQAGGSTAWPQLSPGPGADALKNIASRGSTLHLLGIFFEAGAAGGNLICKPSDAPSGVTPANVTTPIPAAGFLEIVPESIDPSTTALPFQLWYGPLGVGSL